jgi:hypothetical protein
MNINRKRLLWFLFGTVFWSIVSLAVHDLYRAQAIDLSNLIRDTLILTSICALFAFTVFYSDTSPFPWERQEGREYAAFFSPLVVVFWFFATWLFLLSCALLLFGIIWKFYSKRKLTTRSS